jgi:hypothetical protein
MRRDAGDTVGTQALIPIERTAAEAVTVGNRSEVAVTVAAPLAIPVTSPPASTLTTSGLVERHAQFVGMAGPEFPHRSDGTARN